MNKELREKFFKECTTANNAISGANDAGLTRFTIAPHDLFEWFARNTSKTQTIKTVNPHGYRISNVNSNYKYYVDFEDMNGRTLEENDIVTPLYTMQLTDKVEVKCEHKNISSEDGLDECLDCGVKNY